MSCCLNISLLFSTGQWPDIVYFSGKSQTKNSCFSLEMVAPSQIGFCLKFCAWSAAWVEESHTSKHGRTKITRSNTILLAGQRCVAGFLFFTTWKPENRFVVQLPAMHSSSGLGVRIHSIRNMHLSPPTFSPVKLHTRMHA